MGTRRAALLLGVVTLAAAGSGSSVGDGEAAPVAATELVFETNRAGSSDIYAVDAAGKQRALVRGAPNDAEPAASPDGGALAFASDRDGTWQIFTLAAGRRVQLTRERPTSFRPVWAPDGKRIAFETSRDGNWEIYVMNADGTEQDNVSQDDADDFAPSWSPKGDSLVFERVSGSRSALVTVDLSTGDQTTLPAPGPAFHPSWSPLGDKIAYDRRLKRNYDVHVFDLATETTSRLTEGPAEDSEPVWSPDARQIAFTSRRDGDYEIYVMDAAGKREVNRTRRHQSDEVAPAWRTIPAAAARSLLSVAAPAWELFPCSAAVSTSFSSTTGVTTKTYTNGADRACGSSGKDVLKARGGNDWLSGKLGADDLRGGPKDPNNAADRDNDSFCARDGYKDVLWGGTPLGDSGSADSARIDTGVDPTHGIEAFP